MATALLIGIGVAVCLAVQLLVQRYWFGFFLSIVANMIAWIVAPLMFALATAHALVTAGQWGKLEAVLGALLIAQCVSRILIIVRRMARGN